MCLILLLQLKRSLVSAQDLLFSEHQAAEGGDGLGGSSGGAAPTSQPHQQAAPGAYQSLVKDVGLAEAVAGLLKECPMKVSTRMKDARKSSTEAVSSGSAIVRDHGSK